MYFVQVPNEEITIKRNLTLKQQVQKGVINSFFKLPNNRFVIIGNKKNTELGDYNSQIYKNEQNKIVIVLPRIVISLKKDGDIKDILKESSGNLEIESGSQYKYILKCNFLKSDDVLKLVNELSNRIDIDWCEPELLSKIELYNTLFPQQYYLNNTGQNNGTIGIDINIIPAWNITIGSSNIKVAVIDQGVDRNHEDLLNRVLDGYTIRNVNGLGEPQNENNLDTKGHGMACSGIIAANNNTIGIRGITSNVQILPVNIVPDFAFLDSWGNVVSGFGSSIEIAQAINWAWHRADVLSNSWGGGAYSNEIVSAIDSARTFGRNGKGSIVVFASGNNYPNASDVSFPANVNGVITVGAINKNGSIWNYSQRGASMDLVAPSGNVNLQGDITTTDRMDNLGYNTTNYMTNFGGTSAACPQVAGVAALMLSANSNLTETQVRTTLQNTARDLGAKGFDNTYGYGLVDANAAISSVAPIIFGSNQICSQSTYTVNTLPVGASVAWSVTPSNIVTQEQNGQGVILTRIGTGTIVLSAVINSNTFISKTILVDGVPPNSMGINNISNLSMQDVGIYQVLPSSGNYNYEGILSVNVPSEIGISYTWSLLSSTAGKPVYWWPNGGSVDVAMKQINTTLTLKCTASNGCGSYYQYYTFTTSDIMMLSLAPNPSTSSVEVSLVSNDATASTTMSSLSTSAENTTQSYVVTVVDSYGSTVYSGTKKDKKFNLQTATFRNGIYSVIVTDGTKVYQNKLIVQH
jgi:subtilisin family serine protease